MLLWHLLLHVLIYHFLTAKENEVQQLSGPDVGPLQQLSGPHHAASSKQTISGNLHQKPRGIHNPGQVVRPQSLRGQIHSAKSNDKSNISPPRDTNFMIREVKNCTNRGPYFLNDHSPNKIEADNCFICFCQHKTSAVCWRREKQRCIRNSLKGHVIGNSETKSLHAEGKDTRKRRSPGFADILFRDASRDAFNKNTDEQQCKPYESSFSDDCPPADWCTGCTVCDCDSNGRWDCHILSFCTDPKKKTASRKMVKKRPTTTPLPIGARPRTSLPIMKRRANKRKPSSQKKIVKKSIASKTKPKPKLPKKKQPITYKRVAPKSNNSKNNNNLYMKKNMSTHKPIHINNNKKKVMTNQNSIQNEMAQKIMKRMMSVVNKLVQKEIYNMTKMVAKIQQKANTKNIISIRTTYKPRIIGGTRKRTKREVEFVSRGNKATRNSFDFKYEMNKTSTINISTMAPVLEDPHSSTSTMKTDIKNTSTSSSAESMLVIPMSITERYENDYFKYVVATNIIPLRHKQAANITAVYSNETSTQNITDRDRDRVTISDETTTHKQGETTTIYVNKYILWPKKLNEIYIKNNRVTEPLTKTDNMTAVTNTFNIAQDIKRTILPNSNTRDSTHQRFEGMLDQPLTEIPNDDKLMVDYPGVINYSGGRQYKLGRKDINRIRFTKKYNLLKVLDYHRCPFLNNLGVNDNETLSTTPDTKHTGQNLFLINILNSFNNTNKQNNKLKKFNFMRYLRQIFNNFFRSKNNTARMNKYPMLETLCQNFGPCNIDPHDRNILKSKLSDLNIATIKILKTVKVIKGLLILLNDSVEKNKTLSKEASFRSDIKKLNCILRSQYSNCFKEPITETKKTQIEYVKQNTNDFITSVSQFTILLNRVIGIISKPKVKVIDVTEKKPIYGNSPFQKLKRILVKYNLAQNSFIKKMYDVITSFENKTLDKPKTSIVQRLNSSEAVENFSKKILRSLRKLKYLADTLNSTKRTKRETRDDDALEYLLILMEYLLKQNHPLDTAPANDGIDLLIETIQSAPDIKVVRKKVLTNAPLGLDIATTASTRNILYRSSTETPGDDNEPEKEIVSREDHEKTKKHINQELIKLKESTKDLFDIVNKEKDTDDKIHLDRIPDFHSILIDTTTGVSVINTVDRNALSNSINLYEPRRLSPLGLEDENVNSVDNSSVSEGAGNGWLSGYNNNRDNTNVNYDDNAVTVNVFGNTENDNVETNTISHRNYDDNTQDDNIYHGKQPDGNAVVADVNGDRSPLLERNGNGGDRAENEAEVREANDNIPKSKAEGTDHANLVKSNDIKGYVIESNSDIIHGAEGQVGNVHIADGNGVHVHMGEGRGDHVQRAEGTADLVHGRERDNDQEPDQKKQKLAYKNTPDVVLADDNVKVDEDGSKKSEIVLTGEIDDEETTTVTIAQVENEIFPTISPNSDSKVYKMKEIKFFDSYDADKDKKFKLEWIDENFRKTAYDEDKSKAQEDKRENIKATTVSVEPLMTKAPAHIKRKVDDISMLSYEVDGGHKRKKPKLINTDEVMFKKHMGLMNSLDYVTEKTQLEENDSKDGNADDKYSEAFSSYFV